MSLNQRLYNAEMKQLEQDYIKDCNLWRDMTHVWNSTMLTQELKDSGVNLTSMLELEFKRICYKQELLRDKYLNSDTSSDHTWIGINPPPEKYNLTSLQNKMVSYTSGSKHCRENYYIYCVEQHTNNGIRPHIHFLVKTSAVKPNRWVTQLVKHFGIQPNFIDVKINRNNYLLKEHINYIKGEKQDSKNANTQDDKAERVKQDLPDYTENII